MFIDSCVLFVVCCFGVKCSLCVVCCLRFAAVRCLLFVVYRCSVFVGSCWLSFRV